MDNAAHEGLKEREKARKQQSLQERQIVALEQIADSLLILQNNILEIGLRLDKPLGAPPILR